MSLQESFLKLAQHVHDRGFFDQPDGAGRELLGEWRASKQSVPAAADKGRGKGNGRRHGAAAQNVAS